MATVMDFPVFSIALAREIGYTPYMICGRVPGSRDGAADGLHVIAVVECINGLYYDPEARGQYAGWMTYGFMVMIIIRISHQIQRVVNFCTY